MDSEYARQYRDLYHRHWWWRARERLLVSTLRTHAPAKGWTTILDVGCGDGLFFDRLLEFGDVEGVESDDSLVDPGGRWASRIRIQPFDETFQPARRYSLITMLDVLEHLPDARLALRRARSLLELDGMLVATVPALPSLWTSHDDINHHVQRFTKPALIRLARDAGFVPMFIRYFYFWTCPIKLLIRLKERAFRLPSGPARLPSPVINRSLYALSVFEEATFGHFPIPFGSSLLLIARRDRAGF